MSTVTTIPFPVATVASALLDLAFPTGQARLSEGDLNRAIAWASGFVEAPDPVLYDQDSPRNAGEFDPEIEALLREEEEIERSVQNHHVTSNFDPAIGRDDRQDG